MLKESGERILGKGSKTGKQVSVRLGKFGNGSNWKQMMKRRNLLV
jgi:topoisomerase IA-like protein